VVAGLEVLDASCDAPWIDIDGHHDPDLDVGVGGRDLFSVNVSPTPRRPLRRKESALLPSHRFFSCATIWAADLDLDVARRSSGLIEYRSELRGIGVETGPVVPHAVPAQRMTRCSPQGGGGGVRRVCDWTPVFRPPCLGARALGSRCPVSAFRRLPSFAARALR